MIKQDFYIANLIARYLSEEITPGRNNKTNCLERRIYSARDFIQEKFVMKKTKSNISGKIRHSILHPDGKKWKSESKEIITEADISK